VWKGRVGKAASGWCPKPSVPETCEIHSKNKLVCSIENFVTIIIQIFKNYMAHTDC
jgi:hypothetical protein